MPPVSWPRVSYVAFGKRISVPLQTTLYIHITYLNGPGKPSGMLDTLLLFSLALSNRDTGDIRMVKKVVTFNISDLPFASLIFTVTDKILI